MEEWRKIEGYEDSYQVSNHGRVKSLRYGKEKILKGSKDKNGYNYITLSKNKIEKHINIHRLVAQAFIPNPDNKSQVNHKNGIKTDNHVSNLEWNTAKENNQHAVNTGLRISLKGEKHYKVKLTEEQVLEIRTSILANTILAKIYNVCPKNIYDIKLKKTWKHI